MHAQERVWCLVPMHKALCLQLSVTFVLGTGRPVMSCYICSCMAAADQPPPLCAMQLRLWPQPACHAHRPRKPWLALRGARLMLPHYYQAVSYSSGRRSHNVPHAAQPETALTAQTAGESEDVGVRSSPTPPPSPHPSLDAEIAAIALPMLLALAADPIAGLVDTAMVGRIGAVELAGLGVGLSIFNTISKFLNVPLVSATTTAVAEAVGAAQARNSTVVIAQSTIAPVDDTDSSHPDEEQALLAKSSGKDVNQSGAAPVAALELEAHGAANASSSNTQGNAVATAASSALLMSLCIGIVEAGAMYALSPQAVHLWGLAAGTAAHTQGTAFLQIRAATAPFTVVLLTLQGVFRGLADTKTPLKSSLAVNILNVVLAPLLIFSAGWGVRGAAAAVGISQVVPCLWLLWRLSLRVNILSVKSTALQHLLSLLKPSGLLLLRTASVTATYAYATSAVARAGPAYAAAHQVAFTLWLSTTLLADSLAVAAQSLLATKAAAGDVEGANQAVERCVQLGGLLGVVTAALVGAFRQPIAGLFSEDATVLAGVASVMPLLILTQPINALAFVWDGVLFGAGGFRYASLAMAACAVPACALIAVGASHPAHGLMWVWGGLSALMLGRAISIWLPWTRKVGPFEKLRASDEF